MASSAIEIKVLKNPADNWELLLEAFLDEQARNTVMAGILPLHTAAGQKIMAEILKQMIETINGPVIIAWDTDIEKVVGSLKTRIVNREINDQCSTEQPGRYTYTLDRWDEATAQDLRNVMDFFSSSRKEADILNRYPELDQYAAVFSYGVLEAYGKRNIGSQIMEKALCELRQMDVKLVYGNFSSLYSQKVALKFGFAKICSQEFESNFLSYQKVPDHIKKVHTENWGIVKKF